MTLRSKEQQLLNRSDRVAFRKLAEGQGGVLLRLDSGAYHGVNETGAMIWDALDDGATLDALVDRVRSRLEDAPPGLRSDIVDFLEDLLARELIVAEEPN